MNRCVPSLGRRALNDGALETLKWIGLVLMTGDHGNQYLFNGTLPILFEAGRLCLPIFVIVLAHHWTRPDTIERGVYPRTIGRLVAFGAVASIPFIALGGLAFGWWPLNVLFTLLVITATAFRVEKGGSTNLAAASAVLRVGGSLVEYGWPAVLLGLAAGSSCKRPSIVAAAVALLSCAALGFINENGWAWAALPLLWVCSRYDVPLPRLRWLFYADYPFHLAVLWFIRIPMTKQGYLFFT